MLGHTWNTLGRFRPRTGAVAGMKILSNSSYHMDLEKLRHRGLEPSDVTTCKPKDLQNHGAASGAFSGAVGTESGAVFGQKERADPALAAVVKAWPTLPPAVRAGILAMVGAASKGE